MVRTETVGGCGIVREKRPHRDNERRDKNLEICGFVVVPSDFLRPADGQTWVIEASARAGGIDPLGGQDDAQITRALPAGVLLWVSCG
jgi:hypothetical protein